MPNVSSALGTSQGYIPIINAGQLGKAAGLVIHFPTEAAMQAAIAAEKANIAAASPLWSEAQLMSNAAMPPGIFRVWAASGAGAAIRVKMANNGIVNLAADTNVVTPTTGLPLASLGAQGDMAIDTAGNSLYTKGASVWTFTQNLGRATPGTLAALFFLADVGKTVTVRAPTLGQIVSSTLDAYDVNGVAVAASAAVQVKINGTVVTASAPPTLAAATTVTDAVLTGWTKTYNQGDLISFTLTSASVLASVAVTLSVLKS